MEAYALTDTGRVRSMNQDYIYASPEKVGFLPDLFLVADGMGGHKAGDYASRFMVENLVVYLNHRQNGPCVTQLKEGIKTVNKALYEMSLEREEFQGMGCTLVAAVIEEGILYAANVGDSRLYLIQGQIHQVTKDHSLVQEMVRMGEIKPEEARNHPDKNIITRALGAERTVDIDFFDLQLEPGSTILMCSDGLSNMVEDAKIEEIIQNETDQLPEKGEKLLREANQNGGKDNIAVVLVEPFTNEVDKC